MPGGTARGGLTRFMAAVGRRQSVVVCHHGVGESSLEHDPYFLRVPQGRLRAQIELLLSAGFRFCTVSQLVAGMDGGAPPAGHAVLTFDDGMEDNHSVLLPLLADYGISATIYVTTGLIGGSNPFAREQRMMTRDQLRDVADAGVELGAHTVSHPDLSRMSREECLHEMVASRDELEELTGRPVRAFAYPFCRYGPAAMAAAREAGFSSAATCDAYGSWDRFELKRAILHGKDGLAIFSLKAAYAYYPLANSPPGTAFRAATRASRSALRRWRRRA